MGFGTAAKGVENFIAWARSGDLGSQLVAGGVGELITMVPAP